MKTDQNGDTLWTRSAGPGNAVYETYNFLACADGGFLYDGETYSGPAGTYLFKTDSLGHLPCWEKPPPPISISDLFPTDSSFTLTSVDGAVALPPLYMIRSTIP